MRRKRIAIAAAVVLALLIGVVLALPWLVDVNRYRGRIESLLESSLNRDVTLGRITLRVLPPGLRVEDAVIAEDPAFGTERPFARAGELSVNPRLLPLLRGVFELRSVVLRQPEIELVRDANGRWNVTTIGGERETAGPAPEESSDGGTTSFVLGRLAITGGQVAITDLASPSPQRSVYRNIDFTLENFAPDREFDLELGATLPGEGAERLTLSGRAGPLVREAMANTPFTGALELDEVSIGGVQRFLQAEALQGTDARISGTINVRHRDAVTSASGSLDLDDAVARGLAIGYPIAAEFDVSHDSGSQQLSIGKGRVRLGDTPIGITGAVNLASTTPELDLHVTAADASLAEAARLASAFGVAFGRGTEVEGQANLDVRARGAANRPALQGSVNLRNVSISGADIPAPVRTERIDITLTPQEIRADEFTATTDGTSVGVQFAVREYSAATPVVDARVRATDADLGGVLNIARAWGVEAVDGVTGAGRLTVDARAAGPVDALSFSGSGSLREAAIRSPALTEPLRIQNAVLNFEQDAAVLQSLNASLAGTTVNGRLSVRNFSAPALDFDLSADRIDVKALQQVMQPSGGGAAAETPQAAPQKASPAPAAAPEDSILLRTTGTGRLRAGAITYDEIVLENLQATATLDRGLVRLDPVTASLFGGQHRGSIVMDARQTPAAFSIASDIAGVDANRLASAATNVRNVIYGALTSNLRMSFTADGADTIARSLNGTMALNLANGRIANMNIGQEVANIARFVTGAPKAERTTQVAKLSGTFDVKGGVARTEDLTAAIEGGTLGAAGSIDLASQALDLRVTTVLSKEFASRVGGTQVGGFMTTALANQAGELVVPMLVTGTLAEPRFAPDTQRIAEMKVKSLVPSLSNPQGLTSGILGAVTGRGGQSGGRGAVGDIIGSITGRGAAGKEAEAQPQDPAKPAEGQAAPSEQKKDPAREVGESILDLLRRRKQGEQKPQEQPAK